MLLLMLSAQTTAFCRRQGGVVTRRQLTGSLLELDHLKDTVLHFLDRLELSETHAPLVRNIIDATLGLGMLAAGTYSYTKSVRTAVFSNS